MKGVLLAMVLSIVITWSDGKRTTLHGNWVVKDFVYNMIILKKGVRTMYVNIESVKSVEEIIGRK